MKHNKILSLATLAVLSVFGIHHFAYATVPTDSSDVDVEVNVHQRITVALSADTVTLNLKPTISTDFDSSDITATVVTNNPTGYTLTMSPADDTTTYLTRVDGTETIPTLTPLEGGYTEQTFTTNTWGYKLVNTNYLNFATSNEIIVTDAPTAGTSSVVTFGAKGDTNLHSGTYELEIAFTAVANAALPTDYDVTVSMDSNTESVTFSDGTTTQTATQSNPTVSLAENTSYTITATFATGYELSAWSATAGTLGSTTANPTTYTTTNASSLSVTSKQSQIGPVPPTTCNTPVPGDYTYLQDINSSNKAAVLASLTEGNAYYLRDSRDEEPYCISKLADGNLWFLDNLRFDIVAHKDDISSTNTNITNSATLTSLKSGNRSAGNNYATAGVSYWGTDNSYSAPLIAIKNASDTEGTGWNPNTTTTSYGAGSGKIGVYYNFCAASAGSYCYGNGSDDYGVPEGDAVEDICPAGWRMPTGGSSGEYQALYTAYSSNATNFRNSLSTPLSGLFRLGSAGSQGSYGRFWSSTRRDDYGMYYLNVDSSDVSPQRSNYRSLGYSVRCFLR